MSLDAPEPRPLDARVRRVAALLAVCAAAIFGILHIASYAQPGFIDPFTDAVTYLAAGERLVAGHDLCALAPGDRLVVVITPFWTAPLLYPPTIAVLWAPLASLHELGLALWIIACTAVMIGSTWYVASRSLLAAALVLALSPAIGEQLAVANVNSLFVGGLLVVWCFRARPWVGAILGVMTAVKGLPVVFAAWLAGRLDIRGLGAMGVTTAAVVVLGIAVVGVDPFWRYVDVVRSSAPSPMSLGSLGGGWLTSTVIIVSGSALSVLLGLRGRDRASFAVATISMTLGTPALYTSGLVLLLPAIGVLPRDSDLRLRSWPLRDRATEV